jgi:type I restriction enzyme R subunit
MTCQKDDPAEWRQYERDRGAEAKVKARFRDADDPLRFLIVTAKLLTGFDAPIEGVMYLDKPLRAHTLFQAMTRTNRRWTNPHTGQEKTHGLIVDYVGLGKEIADAIQIEQKDGARPPLSIDELIEELHATLNTCLARFEGIDLEDKTFVALQEAQQRLADPETKDEFAAEFLKVHALWEMLWPERSLKPVRNLYKWLARVYQSVQPATTSDALLWHRLGAKTLALVSEHIASVNVRGEETVTETVTTDEETVKALQQLGLDDIIDDEGEGAEKRPPHTDEIIKTIEGRVKARLGTNPKHPVYTSLAERLDGLRKTQIETAADSVEFLKRLLESPATQCGRTVRPKRRKPRWKPSPPSATAVSPRRASCPGSASAPSPRSSASSSRTPLPTSSNASCWRLTPLSSRPGSATGRRAAKEPVRSRARSARRSPSSASTRPDRSSTRPTTT